MSRWVSLRGRDRDSTGSLSHLLCISKFWNSQAVSSGRCCCFISILETRIKCLLLPLLAQSNPSLFCLILYIRKDSNVTVVRPDVRHSRDAVLLLLSRLGLYTWEGLRWMSFHCIYRCRCNISQGINRTMECWQRGRFSVTVETLQLFLELYSLFICIWILINRALAAYSWIFKWKCISHYYPLLVSQAPSCKFAAE